MFCKFSKTKYTKAADVIFHVGCNPPPKLESSYVRCICIGDTLGDEIKVPAGDILIHTGNFTECGDMYDAYDFNKYLNTQPHKYKVVLAGENEGQTIKELMRAIMRPTSMFLNGESTILFGVKIICASYIDEDSVLDYNTFDTYADIVVSHVPPYNILDSDESDDRYGSKGLAENLNAYPPKVCLYSNPAASHGARYKNGTLYINCGIYGTIDGEKIKYGVPLTVDIKPTKLH